MRAVVDEARVAREEDPERRVEPLMTDVGLPGRMDGRQVAESARERWPGLPVQLPAGYAAGRLAPGSEVVGKPLRARRPGPAG
jgi:hypothetical protein